MLETSKTNSRVTNTISKHLNRMLLLFPREKKHLPQLSKKSNPNSLLLLLLRSTTRTRELRSLILMRKRLWIKRLSLMLNGSRKKSLLLLNLKKTKSWAKETLKISWNSLLQRLDLMRQLKVLDFSERKLPLKRLKKRKSTILSISIKEKERKKRL